MALSKVYTKSPCSLDSMISQIQHDTRITVALDLANTNLLGSQLTIAFLADLSDWTYVDADVTAHDGTPLPNNQAQLVQAKPFVDNTISGTFTGNGNTLQISTIGCSSVQYGTVNHAWVGNIITELSYDNGANWFPCSTADTDPDTNLLMTEWGDTFAPAFNSDPWEVNCSGSTLFRLRVTAYTSGSLDIVTISSAAASDVLEPSCDRWTALSISALNAIAAGSSSGCSTCNINIRGTWVGTISFYATVDNVNFDQVSVIDASTGFQVTTTSTSGTFIFPCGGYNRVKAKLTAYTSGSAVVTLDASEGASEGLYPVDPPIKYSHLTSNVTTTVKSGTGRLHSININNNNTGGTITVYDNTAGSGTIMMKLQLGSPSGGPLSTSGQVGPSLVGPLGPNGLTFSTGLTVVTAGSTSNDITVIYI